MPMSLGKKKRLHQMVQPLLLIHISVCSGLEAHVTHAAHAAHAAHIGHAAWRDAVLHAQAVLKPSHNWR